MKGSSLDFDTQAHEVRDVLTSLCTRAQSATSPRTHLDFHGCSQKSPSHEVTVPKEVAEPSQQPEPRPPQPAQPPPKPKRQRPSESAVVRERKKLAKASFQPAAVDRASSSQTVCRACDGKIAVRLRRLRG